MNKVTELYRIVWTQVYETWAEPEIMDLTQAREVLAKVMAK